MARVSGLVLLLTLLGGCRTGPVRSESAAASGQIPPSPAAVTAPPTRPDDVREPAIRQVSEQVRTEEPVAIPPPVAAAAISLNRAVSLALAQNPELVTLRQSDNVSSAALGVAQTYPFNPFVQVQATPLQDAQQGGPGTTYHYVLLMQTIQLARQQQFRVAGAASALNSTRWNIHQAELLNVAQTERLYFNVLYQRGLFELAQASHANNRQLKTILEKQLDAGQATAADVAIVRVDTRSTQQQLRLAGANYQTAVRDLRRHLGLAIDDPTPIAGDLRTLYWRMPNGMEAIPVDPSAQDQIGAIAAGDLAAVVNTADSKSFIASWAASRPDVMAAHSDVDVARANLCLASASRTPDLQVGPYYQRTADGTTFLGFRAQMDIPVVNSGRPLEQQRGAELGQRIIAWQQALVRAELEAQAALERYQWAYAAVVEDAANEPASLPRELQNLENQFLEGEVDVVRVVQARMSIIQNQRVRLDILNELAQATAALTSATGIPLEDVLHARSE